MPFKILVDVSSFCAVAMFMFCVNSFCFYQTFNELFDAHKTEGDIFAIVSKAEEFEQIKVKFYPSAQRMSQN